MAKFTPTKTSQRELAPTAKAAKFLRHCKRMGKSPEALAGSGATLTNPFDGKRPPPVSSTQRVVFSGTVRENFPKYAEAGHFPHFVVVAGVTVDVQPRETDALTSFSESKRRLPGYVARVSPLGSIILAR